MQSLEYPDLRWIPPAAFGVGRDGKAVRFIVIHYTAGAERSTSAEDGAAYDQRRTDGTSTHYFVDSDSIVQCVHTRDRANAARARGNRLGIQYELCGTQQTRAQWLDAASLATLKLAARQVARDCKKYGIPVRRLSVAETRQAWTLFPAGPKGIVGHVDCTNAYPEDGGTHTDPGPEFPWDVFLDLVRAEVGGNDMTKEELRAELAAFFGRGEQADDGGITSKIGEDVAYQGTPNAFRGGKSPFWQVAADTAVAVKGLGAQVATVQAAIGQVDDEVLTALADAGRSDEATAAALRAALGDRAAAVGRLLAGQ